MEGWKQSLQLAEGAAVTEERVEGRALAQRGNVSHHLPSGEVPNRPNGHCIRSKSTRLEHDDITTPGRVACRGEVRRGEEECWHDLECAGLIRACQR